VDLIGENEISVGPEVLRKYGINPLGSRRS